MADRDILFWRFAKVVAVLMFLYGLAMVVITLTHSDTLGLRMINAFATMFAGFIGLGSGYIMGARATEKSEKDDGESIIERSR